MTLFKDGGGGGDGGGVHRQTCRRTHKYMQCLENKEHTQKWPNEEGSSHPWKKQTP